MAVFNLYLLQSINSQLSREEGIQQEQEHSGLQGDPGQVQQSPVQLCQGVHGCCTGRGWEVEADGSQVTQGVFSE